MAGGFMVRPVLSGARATARRTRSSLLSADSTGRRSGAGCPSWERVDVVTEDGDANMGDASSRAGFR